MTSLPIVSETALWTAIIRAEDAARSPSICNDTLAARFADGPQSDALRELLTLDKPSVSIPIRHRFIDGVLHEDPAQLVIVLGAGLDTRAHRFARDGRRFVEVDHPELFAWKEARLPLAEAGGNLERIGIDFSKETLRDRLAHLATNAPVLVIAEGLFMYLSSEDGREVVKTLRALFPSHRLVGDLISEKFFARFAKDLVNVLDRHHIAFPNRPRSPSAWFTEAGYGTVKATSLVQAMQDAEGRRLPCIIKWIFRELYDGSVICVAEDALR